MKLLKYSIETLSPVLMSSESGDRNLTETLDYFPGRVVLGILAGKFIRDNRPAEPHNNALFRKLFLSNNVIYFNATKENSKRNETIPTPLSIQSLKNSEEMIFDLLLKPSSEQTKAIGKYCDLNSGEVEIVSVGKKISFHHGRDRATGTSKEGVIFNYESINAGQVFRGRILFEDADDIKNFFESLENKTIEAKIGRSKSAEYGSVKISFDKSDDYPENNIKLSDGKITLTLLSDALLYNEVGFSSTDVSLLEMYLRKAISIDLKIEKSFSKATHLENYVGVLKLKKPSEICFSAGSSFLISGLKDSDIDKLKQLELLGVGERKNEGLGRIRFNMNSSGELVKAKDKEKPAEVEGSIPELAKKFFEYGFRKTVLSELRSKAIEDARELSRNKGEISNSLIGRIELFVKKSDQYEDLKATLKSLRKPAIEQLERVDLKDQDFFSVLLRLESHIENSLPQLGQDLNSHYKFKDSALILSVKNVIDEMRPSLFREYLLTLLPAYKKIQKAKKKSKKGQTNE